MVEVNLYKFGAILVGAVILTLIDTGIGIEWKSYPWWKQLAHKSVYMVWGSIITMLLIHGRAV